MGQFWNWHYFMANAVIGIMLSETSRIALALLEWGIYPDIRLAKLLDAHAPDRSHTE